MVRGCIGKEAMTCDKERYEGDMVYDGDDVCGSYYPYENYQICRECKMKYSSEECKRFRDVEEMSVINT